MSAQDDGNTTTYVHPQFSSSSAVPFLHKDRQWDCRFNVQTDADLAELLAAIKSHYESGVIKYVLVGGVEIGTRPNQDGKECNDWTPVTDD